MRRSTVQQYLNKDADMAVFQGASHCAYTRGDYTHAIYFQLMYLAIRDEWVDVCDAMTDEEQDELTQFQLQFNGA